MYSGATFAPILQLTPLNLCNYFINSLLFSRWLTFVIHVMRWSVSYFQSLIIVLFRIILLCAMQKNNRTFVLKIMAVTL